MAFEKGKEKGPRYQLRYAAGLYWLTDLEQHEISCKKPIAINSLGADIWRLIERGETPEEIVGKLSEEYQTDRETIRNDVFCFLEKLEEQGVI